MAGIAVLHVAAVAVGMAIKGPRPDAVPEAPPILVSLVAESHPVEKPPEKLRMEEVVPTAITPVVQIDLPPEPTMAITLAAKPPAPPPAPVPDAGDSPVSVDQPDYLRMPRVVYPAAAKRAHAQGMVHVRALVDTDGRAREVTVARSSGFELLDRAACDAVLQALFMPYRHNNVPRSMVVIVPIDFSLTTRTVADRGGRQGRDSELDVGGEHHHAMGRHAEELRGLGAASLHVGEEPELQVSE
jgi:protein TonB